MSKTVEMVKQNSTGQVIAKANVHPDEIANYQTGGWILPTMTETNPEPEPTVSETKPKRRTVRGN